MNQYYIDKEMVEHGCCWDTAIVIKCEPGQGKFEGDVDVICECNNDMAQIICDALNFRLVMGE